MQVTFDIQAGRRTWTVRAHYTPDDPDTGDEAELEIQCGVSSDGRELRGLNLDAELEPVECLLPGLARAAYGRRLTERWAVADAARVTELAR